MLYEITYRMGMDSDPETVVIEADNEIQAIMMLGHYRGKRAVKRIKEIRLIGVADITNPLEEIMVLR